MGPEKMIVVPPRHYCLVENPAVKDKDGKPVFDTHGQACHLYYRLMHHAFIQCIIMRVYICMYYTITSVITLQKTLRIFLSRQHYGISVFMSVFHLGNFSSGVQELSVVDLGGGAVYSLISHRYIHVYI